MLEVPDAGAQSAEARARLLEERRTELTNRIDNIQYRRNVLTVASVACVVAAVLSYWLPPAIWGKLGMAVVGHFGAAGMAIYSGIIFATAVLIHQPVNSLRGEKTDLENQLDLIRIADQSHEQKAQKLLQIQQFELKRYYDQTLRQSSGIFWVGVLTMLLGFAVIGWSIYFVAYHFNQPADAAGKWSGESVIVAVLGAIGGILTNFVGAMYIKMFSEIIQAVTRSHTSLVATTRFYFANLLAANIQTPELREQTLSDLAHAVRLPPNSDGAAKEAAR